MVRKKGKWQSPGPFAARQIRRAEILGEKTRNGIPVTTYQNDKYNVRRVISAAPAKPNEPETAAAGTEVGENIIY